MDRLSDLLLVAPISQTLLKGLLFTSFTLHMLFVLFTLGTAMLALYYFIDSRREGHTSELRLDKRILKTFMAHKSLAVVLGVAPLLLIQVGYTVPFFTAVNLFTPYWMLVIVFLIAAFLAFDILGHRVYVHRYIHLASGVVAIIALLAVPGFFSAILTAFENPDHWQGIMDNGYRLTGLLAVRWLFKYLHVLGAGVVCGSGFHYFFTAMDNAEKNTLQRWFATGILLQFISGAMLYGVSPSNTGCIAAIYLFTGVTSASFLMWLYFYRRRRAFL